MTSPMLIAVVLLPHHVFAHQGPCLRMWSGTLSIVASLILSTRLGCLARGPCVSRLLLERQGTRSAERSEPGQSSFLSVDSRATICSATLRTPHP